MNESLVIPLIHPQSAQSRRGLACPCWALDPLGTLNGWGLWSWLACALPVPQQKGCIS